MSGIEMKKNAVLISLAVLVGVFVLYQYNPSLFSFLPSYEGFEEKTEEEKAKEKEEKEAKEKAEKEAKAKAEKEAKEKKEMPASLPVPSSGSPPEGFANLSDYQGKAEFGSVEAPAGCYPRDQLTPSELLPKDMNSVWAEQNPMGPGSLKGKNFLSAGALIGVNTVGQSMRNANLQVRSEPPNPQVAVSIFNQSTISPDISHRPLEIGS